MSKEKITKYAVIDLEATSAGSNASIIQVGIVITDGESILDTYQTDVNPHELLSEHIKNLTGISDQQLSVAPEFSQVAKDIFTLIEDAYFVAHNVKFDANLLAEALFMEGYELRTPRIDTVELAQVVYPTLEKYNLGLLSEALDLDLSDAHTAIADALATTKLFIKIRQKLMQLPRETLAELVIFKDNLIFETGFILEEALEQADSYNPEFYQLVDNIVLRKPKQSYSQLKPSKQFDVNLALLGLDERPLQKTFAHLVEEGFYMKEPSFIQAQAGIGKTYGYLLPLLSKLENYQLVVCVPTKILQDQMMAKEIKAIETNFHLSCHSIKGPSNYLKLDLFKASLRQENDNRLVNRYKMQLLVWLLETQTGDLDEIKQKQRFAAYFEQVQHDGDLNLSSPFYDVDFWNLSYLKSKSASILLTNHAYFLHRVEDDKEFAKGKILVFDEAQRLLIQLDHLARKQVNIGQQLQELSEHKLSSPNLLDKRIYESLIFELSQLSSEYYRNPEQDLSPKSIQTLKTLVEDLPSDHFMELKDFFRHDDASYWITSEKSDEKRQTYLQSSNPYFTNFKQFLPETVKTYYISATLDISPQVSLSDLLGYDVSAQAFLQEEKSANQLVFVDKTMPIITEISDERYAKEIAQRIFYLEPLGQPILVLFNSKQHMFMVSDLLDEWHVSHLTQEKNGNPYNIKNRFDKGEQKILLGMGAFWEGVDFIHADRMIEIITRLPFDNPKDQFVKKMSHYLVQHRKNPFKDYFLPMTILKLKQAIGRTMRRDNQKSTILILDSRMLVKSYGSEIMTSLSKEFLIKAENFPNTITEMSEFLL